MMAAHDLISSVHKTTLSRDAFNVALISGNIKPPPACPKAGIAMRDQWLHYRRSGGEMQVPFPNLPTCLPKIRQSLSDPRLDGFRASPSETDLDLLTRYAWNMALAAALYVPLHLLEVALRNALHDTLTQHHGGDAYWYRLPTALPPSLRHPPDPSQTLSWPQREIRNALSGVGKATAPRAADEPGRVVAELKFGFWTSLLSPPYGSPRSVRQAWNPLWPQLLPRVFPNFPITASPSQDRATLSDRFDGLRQLRNRISHHEPIWRGRPRRGTNLRSNLLQDYRDLEEAIGWVSPELLAATQALSTFTSVYNAGPIVYQGILGNLP
jgi:hypothetical protein